MTHFMHRDGTRIPLFVAIAALSNVAGNTILSAALRGSGQLGHAPWPYIEALFDPLVAPGVALLALAMFSQMALMSWADLSYVLPLTAMSYVLTALSGSLFLGEAIPPLRWAGVLLVAGGVALVGGTPPRHGHAAGGGA